MATAEMREKRGQREGLIPTVIGLMIGAAGITPLVAGVAYDKGIHDAFASQGQAVPTEQRQKGFVASTAGLVGTIVIECAAGVIILRRRQTSE